MAKVIMVAQRFPSYHPEKGNKTYFTEKIWKSLWGQGVACHPFTADFTDFEPKHHTIRNGKRWHIGDKFSLRMWQDKPYRSKQIQIAPDLEIVKLWDIDISINEYGIKTISINNEVFAIIGEQIIGNDKLWKLAKNDGLTTIQLHHWFEKPMSGQIICWNDKIKY